MLCVRHSADQILTRLARESGHDFTGSDVGSDQGSLASIAGLGYESSHDELPTCQMWSAAEKLATLEPITPNDVEHFHSFTWLTAEGMNAIATKASDALSDPISAVPVP